MAGRAGPADQLHVAAGGPAGARAAAALATIPHAINQHPSLIPIDDYRETYICTKYLALSSTLRSLSGDLFNLLLIKYLL